MTGLAEGPFSIGHESLTKKSLLINCFMCNHWLNQQNSKRKCYTFPSTTGWLWVLSSTRWGPLCCREQGFRCKIDRCANMPHHRKRAATKQTITHFLTLKGLYLIFPLYFKPWLKLSLLHLDEFKVRHCRWMAGKNTHINLKLLLYISEISCLHF